ncbi:5'-3' exonuclease [Salinibacterium sp. ZJ454]|uniref:5'-3' exonuclease n=1 Tax=Salinibacterium sp. ZJ454 TaxID=2708339 RepID=UPI00141E2BDC|nr:5'-3' exonuclease [Salinibacterium sp. ZJ454]
MLLDTASLYFRAFYGVPDTVRAPDGTPVNAVRGLLDMIARLVTDFKPTQLVACWDDDWRPHWRTELIPSYKLHRVAQLVPGGVDIEETPELLQVQIPMIREVLDAFGITVTGAIHHEADDVIGSLATQADCPVDIVTGDRDLFQLVDDERQVRVIYTARGMSKLELVTDDEIVSKYGISPRQYVDFALLRGDTSDGLPGVAGIGEKTAAGLLQKFGDLRGIIAAADNRDVPMPAATRMKIYSASDYLAVAPAVVQVVRNLNLGAQPARVGSFSEERWTLITHLVGEWGLGGSAERLIKALDAAKVD